ncbi:MAG: cation:proton antiporter, partial [Gemmatimonadota bacterium]
MVAMNLQDPALTFALALVAGVLAQSIGRHLRVPGIVVLLATGVFLGPYFADLVRPDTLGPALQPIVGFAIAVVLFEAALNLNADRLRHQAVTIRRLITIGGLITLAGAMLAALLLLDWPWHAALLFGTLVMVTGPTVINPITRRIRLQRNVRTILEAEGVMIDPIGAVIAVVALEVILQTMDPTTSRAGSGLLGFPYRIVLGFVMGMAGGVLIGLLLRIRNLVPVGYENIFTLAAVLAIFQSSNAILPESGILTVAVAGVVVGNMRTRVGRELLEFKEQLSILLVGILFTLLAADVPLEAVVALGWGGVATVLTLMFVVRPLDVWVCTHGTELEWRERVFLAWLAPRGIVAFALSSLFAVELTAHGMGEEGEGLRALVFLVIAITVVVEGGPAGAVASLLGLRTP